MMRRIRQAWSPSPTARPLGPVLPSAALLLALLTSLGPNVLAQNAPSDTSTDTAKPSTQSANDTSTQDASNAPAAPAADQSTDTTTQSTSSTTESTSTPADSSSSSDSGEQATPATPLITGSTEVGFRFLTDLQGNDNTYRSIVNLGQGPKLLNANFNVNDPTDGKLFDRFTVRGVGWGGDPYTTAEVSVSKQRWYDFRFDHRNTAYFNAMPSFANPFLANGVLLNQRSFDTRRVLNHFQLDLLPGRRIVPYLGYLRNSENGGGVTSFVTDGNEYPVANLLANYTDQYNGGVRVNLERFHLTLEEGAAVFKNDQSVYNSANNPGNRNKLKTSPFLGQNLYLQSLLQAYGIRGHAPYTRAAFTSSLLSWLDVNGQFSYSMGTTNANYQQYNIGQFAALQPLLFFTSQQKLANGIAQQPHTSGTIGYEARPMKKLRIVQNYSTDRLHTAGRQTIQQTLTNAGQTAASQYPDGDRIVDNYNQVTLDVLYDLLPYLTLRGGARHVWGNTTVRTPSYVGTTPFTSKLSRPSGVAGASYRANFGLSANFEFEMGSANNTYYRTNLQNFRKISAQVRQKFSDSIFVSYNLDTLNNRNPAPSVDYRFASYAQGITVEWLPDSGSRYSILADYSRTSVSSDILFIVPQNFTTNHLPYRQNAHQASAQFKWKLPEIHGKKGELTAGGSLFFGSGSRPTHLYRPVAKLTVPLNERASWFTEWRWYGFSEPFYLQEGFRTHQLTIGLRLTH